MAVNDGETSETPVPAKGPPADGWNPDVNQDDAIKAQTERIESDIAKRISLICEPETLDNLKNEYASDDSVYRTKIDDLKTHYQYLRRTRPDGNCFFRAFGYAYLESLLNDELELNRFSAILEERKNDLIALGFPAFTVEDFYDQFVGVVERIASKEITNQTDLANLVFNDEPLSNYLVVLLRLVTSGYLQKNEEFYMNFIEGHATIRDFCSQEVEPMYRESDHIHIISITSALDVSVRINYLDRGGVGEKVSIHNFPEGSQPRIHLLYRPGHYDIVYPQPANKAQSSDGLVNSTSIVTGGNNSTETGGVSSTTNSTANTNDNDATANNSSNLVAANGNMIENQFSEITSSCSSDVQRL